MGASHVAGIPFRGESLRTSKTYVTGTHRARAPVETLEVLRPHLVDAGVTRIADVTRLDNVGVPTVLAIRPNSETIACSSGKGTTLEQAVVSGAMEAFELHAAESAELPAIRRSYAELCELYAMPPVSRLPLSLNSVFHEKWPFHWHLGWDIVGDTEAPVPLAVIGMSRRSAIVESMGAFHVTSNGLGAGNTLLEAIASALYETIERDAFACNYFSAFRTGKPIPVVQELSLHVFPLVNDVLDRCKRANVTVIVQDCTADTAVPTFNAIVYDRADRGIGVVHGTGAHLDPEIALLRAITEALQARLNFIAGSRDDMFRSAFRRWRGDWRYLSELLDQTISDSPPAQLAESSATDSFEGDLQQLLLRLKNVGLDSVVVADLTPEAFPVSVVRVVVPGLEGYMHHGYRPGQRAAEYAGPECFS
jgi:ribosomal protein S12 methylthiotransferase accessory factor